MEALTLAVALLTLVGVGYLIYRKVRGFNVQYSSAVYVDTSVLIDGRIVDIVATGFMPGQLVIPRSVTRELQLLADGTDHEKREKARRGLDVVRHLQDSSDINVEIMADGPITPEGVDERLIQLAQKNGGKILTIDYNLNKVAQVEGITVLNINDLAKQLRMSFLPGDQMLIELTQVGSGARQAVGYLEDGTMVVVEQAKSKLGQSVKVEITRSLQTSAGRMMFARLIEAAAPAAKSDEKRPKILANRRTERKPRSATDTTTKTAEANQSSRKPANRKPRRNSSAHHESNLVHLANQDDVN